MTTINVLEKRQKQIYEKGEQPFDMVCDKVSLAG